MNLDKYSSEDLKNIATIINFIKETGTDISSLTSTENTTSKENKTTKEEDTKKKMKDFEDVAFDSEWKNVLETRKNNSADRWCKNEGKTATEADKDYILKKLNGGKPMSDEDIDNILKGIFPNDK